MKSSYIYIYVHSNNTNWHVAGINGQTLFQPKVGIWELQRSDHQTGRVHFQIKIKCEKVNKQINKCTFEYALKEEMFLKLNVCILLHILHPNQKVLHIYITFFKIYAYLTFSVKYYGSEQKSWVFMTWVTAANNEL